MKVLDIDKENGKRIFDDSVAFVSVEDDADGRIAAFVHQFAGVVIHFPLRRIPSHFRRWLYECGQSVR